MTDAVDKETKVVWTVSINRKLAARIMRNLPRDDFDEGPRKGSRSQLIEGLLKAWVDKTENIALETGTVL